jgi:hypothetical protein
MPLGWLLAVALGTVVSSLGQSATCKRGSGEGFIRSLNKKKTAKPVVADKLMSTIQFAEVLISTAVGLGRLF